MRRMLSSIALLALAFAAPAAAGVTEEPFVTITPEPVDLEDGEPLHVVGTGPPGDAAALITCLATHVDGLADCEVGPVALFAPPDFSAPADRFISTVDAGLVDCAVVGCVIGVAVVDVDFGPPPEVTPVWQAVRPVSFASTRAVEVAAHGTTTLVTASFLASPEPAAAFAMRCAGVDRRIVCGDVGTVDLAFDGFFTGEVSRATEWSANGVAVDCRQNPCHVAVIVLGPGPAVVDIIGAPES